jgi:UDP-glucose 4-epimerase
MSDQRNHSLRVLVTGAAGFLGSHAVDLLLAQGHSVRGIDDLSQGRRAHLKAARSRGFQLIDDDLLHRGLFEEVAASFRPDAILHLAGLAGVTAAEKWPWRNRRLHVDSTRVVAEAARRQGIRRVVLASSAAVYGDRDPWSPPAFENDELDPRTELGRAKVESEHILEELARNEGVTCVSARLFNVYGRRQDPLASQSSVVTVAAERFKKRLPVTIFGDGNQTRDFLWVEDAVRGLMLAATRPDVPSGAYNLCTGKAHSVREMVDLFFEQQPNAPLPVFAPRREADVSQGPGDPARALQHLGFSASVSLREGVRALLLDPLESALRRAA